MNREFVNLVERVCIAALKKRGFESPRSRTRFIRLDINFLGWVGLNRENYTDHLQINPFIGIHCIPVMKLKAELAQDKYKEGDLATHAMHMSTIAPDVTQFIFADDTDLEAEADRLADEIVVYALPWMKAHANYEGLITLLKPNIEMLGGYPEKFAAALYFSGQASAARNFVEERVDLFDPQYEGPYSLYQKFGKPFLEIVGRAERKQKS